MCTAAVADEDQRREIDAFFEVEGGIRPGIALKELEEREEIFRVAGVAECCVRVAELWREAVVWD